MSFDAESALLRSSNDDSAFRVDVQKGRTRRQVP
jgi:hypothetical protein